MKASPSKQAGFSLLRILAALAIVGLLYVGVQDLNGLSTKVEEDLVAVPTTSRQTACKMNRLAVSRSLLTWNVTHPEQQATLKKLRDSGVTLAGCPDGGQFSIQGQRVNFSIHKETQDQHLDQT